MPVPSLLTVKIILLPAILFLLLIIPFAIHNAMAATPQLSFGSLGSGSGQLNTPRGIAVDDSGYIYVADNRNHRVEKFDSSGNYVTEFDKGGIPEGIAIYNGTVYVVDRNSTNVKEFTPDGRLLYSFGSQGTNTGQLSNPERIAIDSTGNIYVADTGDIQKFNSKGISISQFLADSKYQCCLNVMGIAVDSSGNVYVADMEFHKIIKFSPTGSTLAEFNATFSAPDTSGTPQDVAVDTSGNIYVADTYDGKIVKLDPAGNPISALAISGVPVGLAIKENQVYVVDIANSRVDMFLTSQFVNNYTSVTPNNEQRKEAQLNQNSSAIDTAIKFAESSPQFQSLVEGYNYSFSSDFEESGPLSTGGIGLTAHGFAFELYSGPVKPGKAVKVVEVLEDPTLTKILNVTSYPAVYMGPMMSATNSTVSNAQNNTLLSPLKQLKSGVLAKDITCNQGFRLILKAEDGSPACVKPDTAQKLMEKGWTREVATSSLDVGLPCNGTAILSPNYHAMMFPVLLMQPNSTSCVKLTYTVIRPYGVHDDGVSWPQNETVSLQISDLNYEGNANEFGITQGKDYTNSFNITTFPKVIDHANYPVGSNFTVTYLIRPLPNATGFYDQSIPMPLCFGYPLAVGYTAEQVNSSDFSKGMSTMLNHSCARGQDELVGVEVRGMSYTEMKLP